MKTCAGCIHLDTDSFVSPCSICLCHEDRPHWSDQYKKPFTKSIVRTQARMISRLLRACHKQRDRAREAEKTIAFLEENKD